METMRLRFEWDKNKAETNRSKHGISFEEATTVFRDPSAQIFEDEEHSIVNEQREIIVGHSILKRLLMVVFVERWQDIIRIISARKATKRERDDYESNF